MSKLRAENQGVDEQAMQKAAIICSLSGVCFSFVRHSGGLAVHLGN
jgi:hypothetical protein